MKCQFIHQCYICRISKTTSPTLAKFTMYYTFMNRKLLFLTRFNKIATQGAPQMALDKEANSLSRVYSYYPKFNLRLFYV